MSERLTNEWVENTVEAFGNTEAVRKGNLAEQLYVAYAKEVYDEVNHYISDREKQVSGIDVSIKKASWQRPYGVDVKGNMNSKGRFFVENSPNGWLRNPKKKNDRVCHICVETRWAIEYDPQRMIEFIGDEPNNDLILLYSMSETIRLFTRRFEV